jgi:hypothetical protein
MHGACIVIPMKSIAELRAEAERKRHAAELARRTGPTMSLVQDRIKMLEHAIALEAEAAGLDAQADALEKTR